MKICCIWLVDSVKSMMMHGLANPDTVSAGGCHTERSTMFV